MALRNSHDGTTSLPDDLSDILKTNRNIFITDDLEETGHEPLIISVGYLGISSASKGVILDGELMPVIREAVERYVRKRNRAKKAGTHKTGKRS